MSSVSHPGHHNVTPSREVSAPVEPDQTDVAPESETPNSDAAPAADSSEAT